MNLLVLLWTFWALQAFFQAFWPLYTLYQAFLTFNTLFQAFYIVQAIFLVKFCFQAFLLLIKFCVFGFFLNKFGFQASCQVYTFLFWLFLNNKFCFQAFAISLLDFATSIIAGVVVFSILGIQAIFKLFYFSNLNYLQSYILKMLATAGVALLNYSYSQLLLMILNKALP